MSIVFIGTPEFAVPSLRRLMAGGHNIEAVITQPDRLAGRGRRPRPPAVKAAAEHLGLRVMQPDTLRDESVLAQIAAMTPEVVVAVAYGQILRRELLAIPPRGVLNVHPSLLPRWRGASPIPAAILAGDEETGVTIMLMDAGMDSGPILAQERMRIELTDTAGILSERLAEVGADLMAGTLPRWLAGEIEPTPQDDTEATKSRILKKEDGAIDWSLSAVEIWRQVRAYNPWPGSHTMLGGELVQILQAWPLDGDTATPGTVVALTPEQAAVVTSGAKTAFGVQTGRGVLAALELQRAGRRAMTSAEFLRGTPGIIGKRLGLGQTQA